MDAQTKAIYKRGAVVILPILAIAACRIGPRACAAILVQDARMNREEENKELRAERQKIDDAREEAAAKAAAEERRRARPAAAIAAAPGFVAEPVASAQQIPDAVAFDDAHIAWLSTLSGEVMVAPRTGGAARVVAKEQKLPRRRHVQGLALGKGYVYWITVEGNDAGAILRANLSGGEPETLLAEQGGLSAIALDGETMYFARALGDGHGPDAGPLGGVYQLAKGKKEPRRILAAADPCAIAVDATAVYVTEPLGVWKAPKTGSAPPKKLAEETDRLACTIAVDAKHAYWTVPGRDLLVRADKKDGADTDPFAFVHKRPTNVVVDGGYVYVLTETSTQGLGELGSIYRVSTGISAGLVKELVRDRVGLTSLAARGGEIVFAGYDESESDGTITRLRAAPRDE